MDRRNFLKGFTIATGALAIAPGMTISFAEESVEIKSAAGLFPTLNELERLQPVTFGAIVGKYGSGFDLMDFLILKKK